MNKALQKWAERKKKTLKKWAKEYHKLCVKEGIEKGPIVTISFDENYVASICALIEVEGESESVFVFRTEASFKHNGKWS